MSDLSNENNKNINHNLSSNNNPKTESIINFSDYVDEDPDPSQVCHRILFKVIKFQLAI